MKRSEAREQAFILLFEKSFLGEEIPDIIEAAKIGRDLTEDPFMNRLAAGAAEHLETIDPLIEKNCIGWKKQRISRVALAAMRLCCYELLYEEDIPASVAINEAVELAKKFAGEEDASYINGVLGTIARSREEAGRQ